jgi:hypothetical protein
MATTPELRAAAQNERDSLTTVIAGADLSILGVAAIAGALLVPPLLIVGIVPGWIRWRASREKTVQERLVEDPPRFDFERETLPRFEPVFESHFDFSRESDELLFRYAQASVEVVGFEAAMIRAIEKALGARERGEDRFARDRAEEAQHFAEETALALDRGGDAMQQVAALSRSDEFVRADELLAGDIGELELPSDPLAALPDPVAAQLFRLGATPDAFTEWSDPSPSVEQLRDRVFLRFSDVAQANTESKQQLARELRDRRSSLVR